MPSMRRGLFVLCAAVAALAPGLAQAWWNDDWKFRKEITFDLSAAGANISWNPDRRAGAGAPVPRQLRLLRRHQAGRRRPALRRRRRQDAAQVPHRALRPAGADGIRLGAGAAARGRRSRRQDLSLLRQQGRRRRERSGRHLRREPGAGVSLRRRCGRAAGCHGLQGGAGRVPGRSESRVADRLGRAVRGQHADHGPRHGRAAALRRARATRSRRGCASTRRRRAPTWPRSRTPMARSCSASTARGCSRKPAAVVRRPPSRSRATASPWANGITSRSPWARASSRCGSTARRRAARSRPWATSAVR